MARDRMVRVRDQAVESSWFGPLVGAGIGALVARALQARARDRYRGDGRWYGDDTWRRGGYGPYYGPTERYEPHERGGGDVAAEVKDKVTAKVGEVKDRLTERASHLRERLPDRERIRASARDDSGIWAIGALAVGALFGFALPESRRERELLEPARRRARELGEQAKDMALEKGSQAMDRATQTVKEAGTGQQGPAGSPPGPDAEPAALH